MRWKRETNIVVIFVVTFILNSCGKTCEQWLNNDFREQEISGVIEKIDYHSMHHDALHVMIRTESDELKVYDFSNTRGDFTNYIWVADRIYKEEGSLKIKVTRGVNVKYFTISCNEDNEPSWR